MPLRRITKVTVPAIGAKMFINIYLLDKIEMKLYLNSNLNIIQQNIQYNGSINNYSRIYRIK